METERVVFFLLGLLYFIITIYSLFRFALLILDFGLSERQAVRTFLANGSS